MNAREEAAAAMLVVAFGLLAAAMPGTGAPDRPTAHPPDRGAARLLFGLRLDLNHESAEQLEALPGIGPSRARAIVAGRPYCAVAELTRVPGVGPVTLGQIAARVEVRPAAGCERSGD